MKHYITTNPDVMGGQPCIVGTRIPVSLILTRLKQGHSLQEVQKIYHWVPLKTFEGALDEVVQEYNEPASYDPQSAQA